MVGLFGRFGRARDLRHLDDELRGAGLHPLLVPDAVKLTLLKLLKTALGTASPHIPEAASLVAYCTLGPAGYAENNGSDLAQVMDGRLHGAVANETGLDAEIILLTLHANIIDPDVVEGYGLDVGE